MKALDDSGLLYLWGKIKSIFSKATNWQNGSATGSVRTSGSREEDSGYTIGQYSVAEGRYTKAIGSSSHAEGYYATASGNYSHAEGASSTASAQASHAEGYYTEASYSASHAEGDHTVASAYCSHAEGAYATASGSYSHAEGNNTTASGDYSHAEGYTTTASGDYSHAGGYGTTARRKSQTAIGEYNVLDPSGSASTRGDYAFIIGNGTSSSARSNAYALEWDGDSTQAGRATTEDMTSAELETYLEEFANNTPTITGDEVEELAEALGLPSASAYRLYSVLNSIVTKVMDMGYDSEMQTVYGNYCKCRRIGNWVYVWGVSSNGISLTGGAYKSLTTLPSGYRPSMVHYFNVSAMGGTQQIFGDIDTNGLVRLYSTGTTAYWEYATVFPI